MREEERDKGKVQETIPVRKEMRERKDREQRERWKERTKEGDRRDKWRE